eukprot:TRINITY_DN1765_c0_g1_i9.p1 TRINITY_DN1765_c0_g1~~TRINITY_DN1765_c0_g1_i9.p1  ORF type:complete len:318 (+),score=36.77 TRINITY_DN1765_c0_g1_i9:772-1725(+)
MGKRVDTAGFEELGSATLNELLVNWVDTKQPFSGDYNCVTVAAQALHNKGWLDKTMTDRLLKVLKTSHLSKKSVVETTRAKLLNMQTATHACAAHQISNSVEKTLVKPISVEKTRMERPSLQRLHAEAEHITKELQRRLGDVQGNVYIAYTEGADNIPHASLFVHYNSPRAVGEGLVTRWVRLDVGSAEGMQYVDVYCVAEDEKRPKLKTVGGATLNELLKNRVGTWQAWSSDFNCVTVVAQALHNKGWLNETVIDRLLDVVTSSRLSNNIVEGTRDYLKTLKPRTPLDRCEGSGGAEGRAFCRARQHNVSRSWGGG